MSKVLGAQRTLTRKQRNGVMKKENYLLKEVINLLKLNQEHENYNMKIQLVKNNLQERKS